MRGKNCFEQLLKTSPKHFDALLGLAQTFHCLNKHENAVENYNKALKENNKSFDCYFGLGL